MQKITLPETFTPQHQDILKRYLQDDRSLNTDEWQLLYTGIDILGTARINIDGTFTTFRQVYERHIDARWATPYLDRLLALTDIADESPALIAEFARRIAPYLEQTGLLLPDQALSWLLYVYCVYWWQAFARGYAFEVQIVRDMQASGLTLHYHDLLDPVERHSVADVLVLDMMGDIKTSTYFLQWAASHQLSNDFYVTRLWDGKRSYVLVVFQQPSAWKKINGGTVKGRLNTLLTLLPRPVELRQGRFTLIVVEYTEWKRRILRAQKERKQYE